VYRKLDSAGRDTAPDVRLPTLKNRQWEKSVGLARRTRASHCLAPLDRATEAPFRRPVSEGWSGQNHARKRARAAPQRSCISTLTRCAQTPFKGQKGEAWEGGLRWSSDGRVSSDPARSRTNCLLPSTGCPPSLTSPATMYWPNSTMIRARARCSSGRSSTADAPRVRAHASANAAAPYVFPTETRPRGFPRPRPFRVGRGSRLVNDRRKLIRLFLRIRQIRNVVRLASFRQRDPRISQACKCSRSWGSSASCASVAHLAAVSHAFWLLDRI
jgi:hypothetical protein